MINNWTNNLGSNTYFIVLPRNQSEICVFVLGSRQGNLSTYLSLLVSAEQNIRVSSRLSKLHKKSGTGNR